MDNNEESIAILEIESGNKERNKKGDKKKEKKRKEDVLEKRD